MKTYYRIYKVGGDIYALKHETLESAIGAAEGISEKCPESSIEILKCIAISSAPKPKTETLWMDGELPGSNDDSDGLPFPANFPELPELPKGKTRWVYRGTFPNVQVDESMDEPHREIRYFADTGLENGWESTYQLSTEHHHIEAI